jgi:hypothetical protein
MTIRVMIKITRDANETTNVAIPILFDFFDSLTKVLRVSLSIFGTIIGMIF